MCELHPKCSRAACGQGLPEWMVQRWTFPSSPEVLLHSAAPGCDFSEGRCLGYHQSLLTWCIVRVQYVCVGPLTKFMEQAFIECPPFARHRHGTGPYWVSLHSYLPSPGMLFQRLRSLQVLFAWFPSWVLKEIFQKVVKTNTVLLVWFCFVSCASQRVWKKQTLSKCPFNKRRQKWLCSVIRNKIWPWGIPKERSP